MSNNTGLRPPPRPLSQDRSNSSIRSGSSLSSHSGDSQSTINTLSVGKRPPYAAQSGRPATSGSVAPSSSMASLQNFSRPAPRGSIDANMRPPATHNFSAQAAIGHRPRQHSQGFFEPSLPHTSSSSGLSASQIAAAAAMHHLQGPPGHERKRSVPGLAPINTTSQPGKRIPSPALSPPMSSASSMTYSNGTVGDRRQAAATAANAAFPRSPLPSPTPPVTQMVHAHIPPSAPEAKPKERSKMKLFSGKSIGIIKDKEADRRNPPLPSPVKSGLRSNFTASTTSLVDPTGSSANSIYSSNNASTSTLVPTPTNTTVTEKDKEKRSFLSRQKNRLKEGDRQLQLSSASSNSQAVDPSAPHSLYSFTPQSPGAQSSFSKSMSGLDLRHGGRALREKKKEEKAAAASLGLTPILSNSSINLSGEHRGDFLGPGSMEAASILGPPSTTSASIFSFEQNPTMSAAAFSTLGNNMGLTGITADDAWPLLKARLLNIFEGQDLRTPIEDFNMLVSVHIRRCIQKRAPIVLIEDLRELLHTGFSSLAQTLRNLPDDRIVSKLVEIWLMVFGTILPFIQAVFLPLDLEFRGNGAVMSQREAAEFWGAMPECSKADERPASAGGMLRLPSLGEELDVRRITLITFRDTVILPKHDILMSIFSRLSLDSINSLPTDTTNNNTTPSTRHRGLSGLERPGTGGSLSPRLGSFNSQTSTLLDAASSSSGGAPSVTGAALSHTQSRSRATSNTSAGSFGTSLPHMPSPLQSSSMPPPPLPTNSPHLPQTAERMPADPAQVTETVARMLQCVSVLAGVQTGDQGQAVVEKLTGALKYNWLGRGRTGRQRRGIVGMRVGPGNGGGGAAAAAAAAATSSSAAAAAATNSVGVGGSTGTGLGLVGTFGTIGRTGVVGA